jgi:hypothetical protein
LPPSSVSTPEQNTSHRMMMMTTGTEDMGGPTKNEKQLERSDDGQTTAAFMTATLDEHEDLADHQVFLDTVCNLIAMIERHKSNMASVRVAYRSFVLSIVLSIFRCIFRSIFRSIYLSIFLSIYSSIYLSFDLSFDL